MDFSKGLFFITVSFLGLLIAIVVLLNIFLNHRLKKMIIESNPINENVEKVLTLFAGFQKNILKWGFILIFGGIGLIILEFLPYSANESPLPYGVEALFLGTGLFCYYQWVKRNP